MRSAIPHDHRDPRLRAQDPVRIAAIYDIHGNLPALEAVLVDIEEGGPDVVVVGGDLASGPMPREALERLMTLGRDVEFIRGNADRELVDHFDRASPVKEPRQERDLWSLRDEWAAQQITREQRDFLAGLPEKKTFHIEGLGAALFCHGSPLSDEDIITTATDDTRLRRILDEVEARLVVCGHTHMQFDRVVGEIRVVNAGSVGMPYERELGAYWALLGPDVSLRRTPYDFDAAARLIRKTGFPEAAEYVTDLFSRRASQQEAIQHFERLARERDRGR